MFASCWNLIRTKRCFFFVDSVPTFKWLITTKSEVSAVCFHGICSFRHFKWRMNVSSTEKWKHCLHEKNKQTNKHETSWNSAIFHPRKSLKCTVLGTFVDIFNSRFIFACYSKHTSTRPHNHAHTLISIFSFNQLEFKGWESPIVSVTAISTQTSRKLA